MPLDLSIRPTFKEAIELSEMNWDFYGVSQNIYLLASIFSREYLFLCIATRHIIGTWLCNLSNCWKRHWLVKEEEKHGKRETKMGGNQVA